MDDELDFSMVEKRNFLLLLSPGNFEAIQSIGNFSTPSQEVQTAENIDVAATWVSLATLGILNEVAKTSKWVTDFATSGDDLPEWVVEKLQAGYYSYSVSLLSHLLLKDYIHIHPHGDPMDNVMNFIDHRPSTFNLPMIGQDDE